MSVIRSQVFEKEFKTQFRPLCLFALRIVDTTEDAEDIVQQAFADVWSKLREGKEIQEIKAYLYRAVRNRCFNHINQARMNIPLEEMEDCEDSVQAEQILRAEREAKLWSLIDRLPTERKKIFLYAKRDGLKYSEIAEELSISIKTVENQMSKAIKSLKEGVIRIYIWIFG